MLSEIISSDTAADELAVYSLCVQSLNNNVMQLWMASRGYSVIQQNNYPTAVYAVGIVATFLYTTISDSIRSRWECSLAVGVTFVVGSAILVAHPANDAGFFFAFYLLGSTYAPQALWYSWMADLTAQDVQLRAITTGFMNSFDFAFVSWWPIVFYPVTDAPDYERGYVASLVTGALTIPCILTIAWLEKKGRAKGEIGRVFVEEVPDAGGSPDDDDRSGLVDGSPGRKDGDAEVRVSPASGSRGEDAASR